MKLFREEAIDASVNPDNLDQAIVLINPKRWIGIVALIVLIMLSASITFFIKIPIKVMGQGVIVDQSGVMELNVTAGANGYLTKLLVNSGEKVKKNQLVATIDLKEHQDKLMLLSTKLKVLKERRHATQLFQQKEKSIKQALQHNQRKIFKQNMDTNTITMKWLSDLEKEETKLNEKGFYPYINLLERRMALLDVKIKLIEAESQIANIENTLNADDIERQRELLRLDFEIDTLASEIHINQTQMLQYSQIKSPADGYIDEIKINAGEIVSRGQTILSLTPVGHIDKTRANRGNDDFGPLEVLLYVPISEGKKIAPGLTVEVDPSVIESREYGKMVGEVYYVSSNVVSTEGMLRTLQNQLLIRQLSAESAVLEVKVKLWRDSDNDSGYVWTSSKGPKVRFTAGTYCTGEVIIKKIRLISLLIPSLATYFEDKPTTTSPNTMHQQGAANGENQ